MPGAGSERLADRCARRTSPSAAETCGSRAGRPTQRTARLTVVRLWVGRRVRWPVLGGCSRTGSRATRFGRELDVRFCARSGLCCLDASKPGFCVELLERIACLGEQRCRLLRAPSAGDPFGVFGEGDGEPERHAVLAEGGCGGCEALVGFERVAVMGGEAGPEASRVRAKAWREPS